MFANRTPRVRARLRACCMVHSPVGFAVTPPRCIRRVPCSMNTRTCSLLRSTVSTCRKSTATSPAAWACRNCRQPGPGRRCAGSMPAACRISHTVEGATVTPSLVRSRGSGGVPTAILPRQADGKAGDARDCRRAAWLAPLARVVLLRRQPAVPGQQRRWRHGKDIGPAPARYKPRQRGEPGPVGRLIPHPSDVPPQYRVLMPEHQQLSILRQATAEHQHGQAEHPPREQVDDLEQHLASQPAPRQACWRKRRSATQSSIRAVQDSTDDPRGVRMQADGGLTADGWCPVLTVMVGSPTGQAPCERLQAAFSSQLHCLPRPVMTSVGFCQGVIRSVSCCPVLKARHHRIAAHPYQPGSAGQRAFPSSLSHLYRDCHECLLARVRLTFPAHANRSRRRDGASAEHTPCSQSDGELVGARAELADLPPHWVQVGARLQFDRPRRPPGLGGARRGRPRVLGERVLLVRVVAEVHGARRTLRRAPRRQLERVARMQELLLGEVRERTGRHDPADPRATAITGAAFSCLIAAWITWIASNQARPFGDLLDQAMAALNPAAVTVFGRDPVHGSARLRGDAGRVTQARRRRYRPGWFRRARGPARRSR